MNTKNNLFNKSFTLFSLLTAYCLLPSAVFPQSSNGTTTLVQDSLSTSGGRVGGGNPMNAITVMGEPAAGMSADSTITVYIGYISTPSSAPMGTRVISVIGSVSETITSIDINGAPGTITGNSFSVNGIQLVEGANIISATATDLAGNTATQAITVYLDTIPPARPTVAAPPEYTSNDTETLTGTKTPNTSVWINGVEVVAINSSTTWSANLTLIEGDNILSITTQDAAGNISSSKTINIVLDELPPVVTFNPPAKTNINPVDLTGSVDDSLTTVSINGFDAARTGQTFNTSVPLILGSNTLSLVATSPNGYVTTQDDPITLGTIPTISTVLPSSNSKVYANEPLTISVTATDLENDPIAYWYLLDGAILTDWTENSSTTWTPSITDLGAHTLTIAVADAYGGLNSVDIEVYVVRKPVEHP